MIGILKHNLLYFIFRSQYKPDNITAIRSDGVWESYQGGLEVCTICAFNSQPVLYFKGFCKNLKISWVIYVENREMDIVYYGYKNSIISLVNNTWTVRERIEFGRDFSKPAFDDLNLEYPVGRNVWTENVDTAECSNSYGSLNLTLSVCNIDEEFTCGNGRCVPGEQRCDYKDDCEDKSDEEECYRYQISSFYNKEAPPVNGLTDSNNKVAYIGVAIDILSINEVQLEKSKIDVSYNLELSWIENRLSYFNILSESPNDTVISFELGTASLKNIWNPMEILSHKLADIGSISADTSSMKLNVKVENQPETVNPEHSFENLAYQGNKGILSQKMDIKGVYECMYDLFRFPFDRQMCTIKLQLKESYRTRLLINKHNSSVIFSGNKLLPEFEIDDYYFYTAEGKDGMEFGFVIQFCHLFQKQMTTLYFQLILLWIVAYLTLYINVDDFSNRFMGAVTALLVMSTLMDNINNRLPVSPHTRLIDIWNIWYVGQIVFLIVFHILVNGKVHQSFKNRQPFLQYLQPEKLNNLAKVGFPVLNLIFTIYYISHNILFREHKSE